MGAFVLVRIVDRKLGIVIPVLVVSTRRLVKTGRELRGACLCAVRVPGVHPVRRVLNVTLRIVFYG